MEALSHDPVYLHARLRPQALACVDLAMDRRWTYSQLETDVRRAVTVLSSKGVTRRDRVATLAPNSVHLVILQLALLRIGAIFVPLNWRLSGVEIARLVEDCKPKILYWSGSGPKLIEGTENGPACRDIAGFSQAVDAAVESAQNPAPPTSNEACTILYTSGSTGRQKGVILTLSTMLATAINFSVLGEADAVSVFLCDAPMFHIIGLVVCVWTPLLMGGTFVVSPQFRPEGTNERLASPGLGVTHYFCVPQMAEALRRAGNFDPALWTRLKALFTGGAPTSPATVAWWLDHGVTMVDGFGTTETGCTLGMPLARDVVRAKAGSVGLPGPLAAMRIMDKSEVEVLDGKPGEIEVGGMFVTPGYWGWSKEDGRTSEAFSEDGWFRTGDIGRRDEDGFVFIVDRKKDMFISGGENVYPVEVEGVMAQHHAVKEVAVVGVPDGKWGETGRAYVVLESGSMVEPSELLEHCQEFLGRYKVPREVCFVEKLPKTGSGKVLKHALTGQALDEIRVCRGRESST